MFHNTELALLPELILSCDDYMTYRKNPKISDTRKFAVITLKVEQDGLSLE